MRVVVFGASGNVGTSLLRALGRDKRVESILGVARRRPVLALPKVEWAQAEDLAPVDERDDPEAELDGAQKSLLGEEIRLRVARDVGQIESKEPGHVKTGCDDSPSPGDHERRHVAEEEHEARPPQNRTRHQ